MFYVRAGDDNDAGPMPLPSAMAIVRATVTAYRRKGSPVWSDAGGKWFASEIDCPLVILWITDESGQIVKLDANEEDGPSAP